jgi:SAM-dependent methyltransferase
MEGVHDSAADNDSPVVTVTADVYEIAVNSIGVFFEPISKTDRKIAASDFLDLARCFKRARGVDRYLPLKGKKMLEIGSGFGTNLAVLVANFGVDGYGVEPGGEGFGQGYIASRKLLAANNIDPERIYNATGESLPFPDQSFDIVYSANVLEHTQDPERVLREAMRVLRPGGLLYVEVPNYLSYFEGHYMVVMPPIFWRPILSWWVRVLFRRDPAFVRTLQTKINPIWCLRQVRELRQMYEFDLISMGEEIFLERLAVPFVFEAQAVKGRTERLIALLQSVNYRNWIGHLIVAIQAHYPIYLIIRKK